MSAAFDRERLAAFLEAYREAVPTPDAVLGDPRRRELVAELLACFPSGGMGDFLRATPGDEGEGELREGLEEFLLDEREALERDPMRGDGKKSLEEALIALDEIESLAEQVPGEALDSARAQARWLSEVVAPARIQGLEGDPPGGVPFGLAAGGRGRRWVGASLLLAVGLGCFSWSAWELAPGDLVPGLSRVPAPRELESEASWLAGLAPEARRAREEERLAREAERAAAERDALYLRGLAHQRARRFEEAADLFRRAAEGGHAQAGNSLGVMLFYGRGVGRDREAGVRWIQAAAELGLVRAMRNMGWYHRDVREDRARSLEWYRRAAEIGDPEAQFQMGAVLCDGGQGAGCREAADWYLRAAEGGHLGAMNNLSALYFEGRGVARDPGTGLSWLRKAGEQGDPTAQYNLAKCYLRGLGVPRDESRALVWLQRAAAQRSPDALFKLGELHEAGRGVSRDLGQARNWFRQAAAEGHIFAPERLRALGGEP